MLKWRAPGNRQIAVYRMNLRWVWWSGMLHAITISCAYGVCSVVCKNEGPARRCGMSAQRSIPLSRAQTLLYEVNLVKLGLFRVMLAKCL